jgi:hypothetical protein
MNEVNAEDLQNVADRLMEVASTLERAVAGMTEQQMAFAATAESQVGRIVATVETHRETELERKLAEAETTIAELQAAAAVVQLSGRKTVAASATTMLAKQAAAPESLESGALDGALASLSVEQRIAVKSELMRAGLVR